MCWLGRDARGTQVEGDGTCRTAVGGVEAAAWRAVRGAGGRDSPAPATGTWVLGARQRLECSDSAKRRSWGRPPLAGKAAGPHEMSASAAGATAG